MRRSSKSRYLCNTISGATTTYRTKERLSSYTSSEEDDGKENGGHDGFFPDRTFDDIHSTLTAPQECVAATKHTGTQYTLVGIPMGSKRLAHISEIAMAKGYTMWTHTDMIGYSNCHVYNTTRVLTTSQLTRNDRTESVWDKCMPPKPNNSIKSVHNQN